MLVSSSRPWAAHSSNLEITCLISPWIVIHLVQLLLISDTVVNGSGVTVPQVDFFCMVSFFGQFLISFGEVLLNVTSAKSLLKWIAILFL